MIVSVTGKNTKKVTSQKRKYDNLLRGGEKVVRVLEVIAVMMTIVTKGQYQRKQNIP